MDYELFQASAVKAFGHCQDVKAMVSDMQQVLSAVPGMVRKNERLDRENAELKQENAALKVELDDWKGNAEGFEPDAYMRLPLDADGVPIRIGDVVYGDRGVARIVVDLRMSKFGWTVEMNDVPFLREPDDLTHKKPEPDDSLERIADELEAAEGWCDQNGLYHTGIVSISEPKLSEWSDRIRKLAKKEGE